MVSNMNQEKLNDKMILGTFEGECADADITNLNGLDITRPVWENVFSSEDYKKGIDLGWYIGFLGHPEDPNCMDFRNACIVMTDGRIDKNGKIYGKFNLIDTPVGRIVKSFIDAGVKFGISVRGAGDVDNNSVDPDTFVFRGFDLVSFPAYPNSIPEFTSIAASSDANTQKKYKNVCKTLNENIDGLNTKESISIVKACFAPQSDEYKTLDEKLSEMEVIGEEVLDNEYNETSNNETPNTEIEILKTELASVTKLYADTLKELNDIKIQLTASVKANKSLISTTTRKIKSIKRIALSQSSNLIKQLDDAEFKAEVTASTLKKVKAQYIQAKDLNLKYKMNIEEGAKRLKEKDRIIASLNQAKSKTVETMQDNKAHISNLENKIKRLNSKIEASDTIIAEYQEAYASIYANAIGTDVDQISVTSSTTVKELEKAIGRNITEKVSIMSSENLDSIDEIDVDYSDNDMITL